MSDVSIGDAGGAPASTPAPAAPAASEVPVDINSSQPPKPIGSQAPDRPQDAPAPEKRSRMDSVKLAFEKATRQQDEGQQRQPRQARQEREAPAADARPGHNQPPEKTEPEKPASPPQRYREGGRFARAPDADVNTRRNADLNQQQPPQGQPAAQGQDPERSATGQPYRKLPQDAPYRLPLRRMSEEAKHAWIDTPEPVRGAVHKMAEEFTNAYKQYKESYDAFQSVRPYHELAVQQGTTLAKALHNYTSMEHKLRTDLVGGLDTIVNNLDLYAQDGTKINIRDVAYHILNMSPEQHRLTQQQNAQTAANTQIGALHQEIAGLKNALNQMHNAQQFGQLRAGVDNFAETHPRFDELADLIENEIKHGYELEDAYQRANLLRPATHAAQTRNTPAQTRQVANRSIHGAPSGAGGSANGVDRRGPPPTRREAIQNAIRRVNGGL